MSINLADYSQNGKTHLRRTQDEDIDVLVDIINAAYSYQDNAKGEPRTNHDHLRKRVGETEFYTLVNDKQIVGCIYLEPKGTALHFGLLTLVPEYRGKGIAEGIMLAIDKYAQENRYETIELDYMSLAPWLKAYYEKYGFAETGGVIKWGSIDLIRMSKPVL